MELLVALYKDNKVVYHTLRNVERVVAFNTIGIATVELTENDEIIEPRSCKHPDFQKEC